MTTTNSESILDKVKRNKWKVVLTIMFLVIAIILGITLSSDSGKKPDPPGPTPVPPAPPIPVNSAYNLYYLDSQDPVYKSRNKISGHLRFKIPSGADSTEVLNEASRRAAQANITLNPKDIPLGFKNSDYIKNVSFSFS